MSLVIVLPLLLMFIFIVGVIHDFPTAPNTPNSKQGASAGERVYGLLFLPDPSDNTKLWNLSVESVRRGFCTPKVLAGGDITTATTMDGTIDGSGGGENNNNNSSSVEGYEMALQSAYKEAQSARVGVHSPTPLVRKILNAGEEFEAMALSEKVKRICTNGSVTCVIEYIFDGSRFRCIVTDPELDSAGLLYASFTLLLGGVSCPRVGNMRLSPPTPSEPYGEAARDFVEARLLQRELKVTLHGTDKSGACLVGTVHHPRGNIAAEILKCGLGRISDWSIRLLSPGDVPPLRIAENAAKVRVVMIDDFFCAENYHFMESISLRSLTRLTLPLSCNNNPRSVPVLVCLKPTRHQHSRVHRSTWELSLR